MEKDNYPRKVWDYTYVQLDKTQLILIAAEYFHVEKPSQSTPAPVLQKPHTVMNRMGDQARRWSVLVPLGTMGW